MSPMTRLSLLSAAAALMMAPAAMAVSYTYVEGGYVSIDNGPADDSGFRLAGSFSVLPNFALIGEYADIGDASQTTAGAVFHTPIAPTLNLFAGGTFEHFDFGPSDDSGFGLRAGLRWSVPGLPIEAIPEIRYIDVGPDDATSLRVTGLFTVAPALSIQAAVQGGDDDRIEVGARFSF